jgi:hypothetical protein
MDSDTEEAAGRPSVDFVESSVLEAIVPFDVSSDIAKTIAAWDGSNPEEKASILPCVPQRPFLFFGMLGSTHHCSGAV